MSTNPAVSILGKLNFHIQDNFHCYKQFPLENYLLSWKVRFNKIERLIESTKQFDNNK